MKNLIYILSVLCLLGIHACTSEDELIEERLKANPVPEPPAYSKGELDLSKYVAIGNSLTAGFTDGALHPVGQANSFPVLLAEQFALVGGGKFVYPQITAGFGFGGLNPDGSARGRSYIDVAAALDNPANAIKFNAGSDLTTSSVTGSSLNNFGVPGARVVEVVVPGYGNLNPYYGNFHSSPTASVLTDAISAKPTFFSIWLGNNDVLGYATSGGAAGEGFNPLNRNTLTDPGAFEQAIRAVITGLSAGDPQAKGVILTIPPITPLPFFQIITQLRTFELIPLTDNATVRAVNAAYADYNAGLQGAQDLGVIEPEKAASRKIAFVLGANPPVITDESLTAIDLSAAKGLPPGSVVLPKIRQATERDLYPLTALASIGELADPGNPASVIGVGVPIPDSLTLTLSEQANVIRRTAQLNSIIASQAKDRENITLVDIGPLFADVFGLNAAQATVLALSEEAIKAADGRLGKEVDGFNMVPFSLSQELLFNSIMSSDGIHPNPRGAALIGNEIIATLNTTYNANIPLIDVLAQPGIFAVLP